MNSVMNRMKAAIARFRSDERASLSIEFVIMFPLLAWVYLGMFVYFDGFRAQSQSDKASFTIADMVSRETNYITPNYIDTLYSLHGMMTRDHNPTKLRISILEWDDINEYYTRVWSEHRGGVEDLTNDIIRTENYRNRLPDGLPHGEELILVEAWTLYEPPFDLGRLISWNWSGDFGAVRFDTFVVVRPRFTSQVCWNPVENGDASTSVC